MKSYEEMARCALEARDEYIRKKKAQQAAIKRYAPVVSSFCFAVVLGFGVWHHMSDLPRIPIQTDTIEDTTEQTELTTETDMTDTETQTEEHPTSEQATAEASTADTTKDTKTEQPTETDGQPETDRQTEISGTKQMTEEIDSVVTEPAITDPVVTDPVVTTPAVTNPIVTNPVITNPVVTTTVATDPIITEPVITEPPTKSNTDIPTTTETPTTDVPDEQPNTNPDPLHWDEMTINQQYNMAEFGEPLQYYDTAETEVSADSIGDFICMAYMSGYDYYSDTYYHCEAWAYQVKGYPEQEVIAIQFEGDDTYYQYALSVQSNHENDE